MSGSVKRRGENHGVSLNGDSKKPRFKRGRNEMRTITRHSRRGEKYHQDEPHKHNEGNAEEDSEEEEVEDAPETSDNDDGIDVSKAYSALLTLLSCDHKEVKSSNNKKDKKEMQDNEEAGNEELEEQMAPSDREGDDDEEEGENDFADDNEEDEDEETKDPFEVHFNQVSDEYVDKEKKLVVDDKRKWVTSSKNQVGNYIIFASSPPGEGIDVQVGNSKLLSNHHIKRRVVDAYESKYNTLSLNEIDRALLQPMLSYKDVCYPYVQPKNSGYRKLYTVHALNHVFKTRDRILKNNAKLHHYQEQLRSGKTDLEEPELRDQGYTRPKVLIILPTRNAAYEVVEMLIKLSGSEQQENKKKFADQYYSNAVPPTKKAEDFIDAFRGNSNDFFCLGLKFTRKSLKLYSSFYSSDILIASPLGLQMILESPDKKKRQYDFLSSIEVLIVDRANQIEMQNWDHVQTVWNYINKIPKEFHDADFSRIRMWALNDQSKLLRQTLVFSEYSTPQINNLLTKSLNLGGKVRFKNVVDTKLCIMNLIGLKIKQVFQRFNAASPMDVPEVRFKYFINTVLPSLSKSSSYEDGLLVYIPSYFDYLRIKSHMKTSSKVTFGAIDEYSSQSKLTRARQQFALGKIKLLLYTHRLHYFRRYEIQGVKTILLYGVPENPIFYKELVRFIGKSLFQQTADIDLSFVRTLYCKWDAVALERIVGAERTGILCNSTNETYEFV